jgi:NAD(P)-dependent dehydrogenase (short-subunit alcohol dehydrogenase family)
MSSTEAAALIIGAGPGIGGAFAAELARAGYAVALASRDRAKTVALAQSLGARAYAVDASQPAQIVQLFEAVERDLGAPQVVLYNPSTRVRGDLLSLDIGTAQAAIQTTAIGALATAQEAARRMIPKGRGALFFTGATAGVKGFARSTVFAMGKFALRGLAQSLAKELGPAGIHVVHFVIDGAVVPDSGAGHPFTAASIAKSYMAALAQPPGAWSWEMELRSHVEPF